MRLIQIAPENVFKAWGEAQKYLQDALINTPEYTIADILLYLKLGSLTLWMFYNDTKKKSEGAMVTEIVTHPRQKVMCVFLLGADCFEDVVAPVFDQFTAYCKGLNIDAIECLGRFGLERLLVDQGFKKSHVVLRCELNY